MGFTFCLLSVWKPISCSSVLNIMAFLLCVFTTTAWNWMASGGAPEEASGSYKSSSDPSAASSSSSSPSATTSSPDFSVQSAEVRSHARMDDINQNQMLYQDEIFNVQNGGSTGPCLIIFEPYWAHSWENVVWTADLLQQASTGMGKLWSRGARSGPFSFLIWPAKLFQMI